MGLVEIKLGDIWQLGKHQLMRGDCTQQEVVQEFLKDKSIKLCITDPPYGVNYEVVNRKNSRAENAKVKKHLADIKIQNDHRASWSAAFALSDAPVLYTWYPAALPEVCIAAQREAGYQPKQSIIWAKNRFALSRSAYHWKHETCSYAVKVGAKADWLGDRKQHTIWEEKVPSPKERRHPTQKPVGLYLRPIENHTREGDWVYDPFAGSGTIFEACQRTARRALGIELDQTYCQRIIEFWEDLTEQKAVYLGNVFYEA